MGRAGQVLTVLCVLALAVGLCGCNKVTGGGRFVCVGPWDQVGVYVDTYEDEDLDWGFGTYDQAGDLCTFGFTGQMDDDPATPWTYQAKGQLQLVDHTQGIILHTELREAFDDATDPKSAEYEAQWESWVPGAKPPGYVMADGVRYPINYVYVVGAQSRWAIVDHTAYDSVLYPDWPHYPIIEEGIGDVLRVSVDYDGWNQSADWIGVVEDGNITVHKAK